MGADRFSDTRMSSLHLELGGSNELPRYRQNIIIKKPASLLLTLRRSQT